MTTALQDLKDTAKQLVLQEFLPGEDPNELRDSTPLITGGILDSLALMKLVALLEQRYGIELEPHDITPDRFDTLARIASTVQRKLAGAGE